MTSLDPTDTIVAAASPPGPGFRGIVRLSGPDAIAVAARVIGRELEDRRIVHAVARAADGARIDDVLAFAMRAPAQPQAGSACQQRCGGARLP